LDERSLGERIALKSTHGWGHLRDDEWAYRQVPLGELAPGRHTLKLVSLANKNNTNIDGFFIAVAPFSPPNTRKEIEMAEPLDADSDPNRPSPKTVDDSLELDDFHPRIDDWYYPKSEADERADLRVPTVAKISETFVELDDGQRAEVGDETAGWRVAEILAEPQPMAAFERELDEWGLVVFVGSDGVVAELRKAVGRLEKMTEPHVRLPTSYYEQLLGAKEDVLGQKVLADKDDPTYEKVVGFLPACHTYTFVGTLDSQEKCIVGPDGTVGEFPNQWGKDKDYHRLLFDPTDAVGDIEPTVAKRGLLGGSLPAANMGFYDQQSKRGWEQCVFAIEDSGTSIFMRVRESSGKTAYYQLDPLKKLDDGKRFYAGLLALKQRWDGVFAPGLKIEVGDQRVVDACRAGLAIALTGYIGAHPKYGMGGYWGKEHDTFPPTTLSLAEVLLDWGLHDQAKQRLGYYLTKFIKDDGSIDYYGPAIAEYGQFLSIFAKCVRQTGDEEWFAKHRAAIDRVCKWILRARAASKEKHTEDTPVRGLIWGSPEADTRKDRDFYFSGDCWCWRGLLELGSLFSQLGKQRRDGELSARGASLLRECEAYRQDILEAAEQSVLRAEAIPFLPPIVGQKHTFKTMTQDRLASYTNYRYWLEALSAQCLGDTYDKMMIDYRVAYGGELLGMTRFGDHLDDWPFWHYASAILQYDRVREFLLGYYGHLAHHQTRGTFTAYEQVPIRGYGCRDYYADYCVPSQLTVPLMTRWMLVHEERDRDVLWLCRATPRAWIASGLRFSGASTRWGRVDGRVEPGDDLRTIVARVTFAGEPPAEVTLRIRHPQQARLAECEVEGGVCEGMDAGRELIRLRPTAKALHVKAMFAQ